MIFPIGDDQVQGGSRPLVSYGFIGLNVLVFLFQVTLPQAQMQGFISDFGAVPSEIVQGKGMVSLVTSMFLHGGWMHLIGNMVFLWVFADNIEATIGNLNFALFYLLGGLAASAAHIGFNLQSDIPAVGASGAISAVLGAYLVMFPKSRVRVLVIYIARSFYMPALYFLGIWIAQQLMNGIFSVTQSAHTTGVAWWAHIGGFAFGILAGLALKGMFLPISAQGRRSGKM